jgi:U4/U6.U5 tri-snRNP-associated protein 2
MPPRKRTAKAAQPAAEDRPKPQKRQKRAAEQEEPAAHTDASAPPVEPSVPEGSTANGDEHNKQPLPKIAPEDDGEDEPTAEAGEAIGQPLRASDLYLDTVNRAALDFDFEKVCSVSLSNINIYGCLVCGKYFQGRSKLTPAFAHSIHDDHHVFINLDTTQVSKRFGHSPSSPGHHEF